MSITTSQKTFYKTSDGTEFLIESEAIAHEFYINMQNDLYELLKDSFSTTLELTKTVDAALPILGKKETLTKIIPILVRYL